MIMKMMPFTMYKMRMILLSFILSRELKDQRLKKVLGTGSFSFLLESCCHSLATCLFKKKSFKDIVTSFSMFH